MKLPFIDSDLFYAAAFQGLFGCCSIYRLNASHCMTYLLLRQPKGIGNVIFSLPFVVFWKHFEKNQKV